MTGGGVKLAAAAAARPRDCPASYARRRRRLGPPTPLALRAVVAALAAPALAHAESHLVGSGPLATTLAPGSTVEKSLRLALKGPVGSLKVWVRIAKAHAGDLTLTLVAPDGRTRLLTKRRGGAGAGLGDGTPGCKGSASIPP